MKNGLLLFLLLTCLIPALFAQENKVQGIVFDKDSKHRLTHVYIYNITSESSIYNNTKGEFSINASHGDTLVAAVEGYVVDTFTVKNQNAVIMYLKRSSIYLKNVTVTDTLLSPAERLKKTKSEYNTAYSRGNTDDLLHVGGNQGGAGAGLGIDALYNLLSRSGKNARALQKIIERDYHDYIVNYRFTGNLVNQITGLSGEKMLDFMQQYRPAYAFVVQSNDYDLANYIKISYSRYLENPRAYRLPPLPNASTLMQR